MEERLSRDACRKKHTTMITFENAANNLCSSSFLDLQTETQSKSLHSGYACHSNSNFNKYSG